jgi:peptide/nickel transport system permease protein
LSTGLSVREELLQRLPASLELVLAALVFAMAVALPLGIAAARHPNSAIDHACRVITTAGVSLPTFFTGLLLAYVFYYLLGWAPSPIGRLDPYLLSPPKVTGFYTIDSLIAGDLASFQSAVGQMILPALTLGIFVLAPIARMTRASMLSVLSADFIRTARASGLSDTTVLVRYGLRNALLPVVTTMGMVFSFLLGMSVIVEKVFAWPGIGSFALEALVASDYAPVQGFVLAMALIYTLLNLAIDLLYVLIDPRVRLGE